MFHPMTTPGTHFGLPLDERPRRSLLRGPGARAVTVKVIGVVQMPVLDIAEPSVAAGFGRPVEPVTALFRELAAAEGGPVAVAESPPRTRCPPGSGHRSRWRRGRWRARRGRRPGRASRWMGRKDWTRVVPPGLRFKASRAPASPVPASRALYPAFLGLPPGALQRNGAKTAAIHTTLNGRTR